MEELKGHSGLDRFRPPWGRNALRPMWFQVVPWLGLKELIPLRVAFISYLCSLQH